MSDAQIIESKIRKAQAELDRLRQAQASGATLAPGALYNATLALSAAQASRKGLQHL